MIQRLNDLVEQLLLMAHELDPDMQVIVVVTKQDADGDSFMSMGSTLAEASTEDLLAVAQGSVSDDGNSEYFH